MDSEPRDPVSVIENSAPLVTHSRYAKTADLDFPSPRTAVTIIYLSGMHTLDFRSGDRKSKLDPISIGAQRTNGFLGPAIVDIGQAFVYDPSVPIESC
ncbi:hypothetical protein R8Z50_08205 [Longispora sp. K20-0274]|uniref:hypothetical protein n=1 Tax=Longispora sp. K20-0274 TaxID=3088255 RepID=UPI00399A17F8